MAYILIEEIEVGMVLSDALRSDSGQILMPEGLELTKKHIPLLNRWKIKGVNVISDDDINIDNVSDEKRDEAKDYLLTKMLWKPINNVEKDIFEMSLLHNLIYKGK